MQISRESVLEREPVDTVWKWQPSKSAWFRRLSRQAETFTSDAALRVDERALRAAIGSAASARAAWLFHPALSPLDGEHGGVASSPERDMLLALWVTAHAGMPCGRVTVPRSMLVWTPAGIRPVEAGSHDLVALAARWGMALSAPLDLDPFGASVGMAADDAWFVDMAVEDMHGGMRDFGRATALLDAHFPDIAQWATGVTRLVVPYRPVSNVNDFRSASSERMPGMVRMDVGGGALSILEALIHESAHQYFYLAEIEQPFVRACFADRRFPSPLKVTPRPLHAVMLAYHALAYICALFGRLSHAGVIADRATFVSETDDLRRAMRDAERTCVGARALLSDAGATFLENTMEVARYDCDR